MKPNYISFRKFACEILESLDLKTIEEAQEYARAYCESREKSGLKASITNTKLNTPEAIKNREAVARHRKRARGEL